MISTVLFVCLAVAAFCQEVSEETPNFKKPDEFLDVNWKNVGKGLKHDAAELRHQLLKGVSTAISNKCSEAKKLFRVAYEQLRGQKEPDVNALTLKYLSRDVNLTYNINSAPRLLAEEIRSYHPEDKLVFYIHGFTDHPGKSSFESIRQAFYANGFNKVLALDGGFLFRSLYLRSTSYVQFVGEKLGEVLAGLVKRGISPSSIHIIGHSLGAHMAGFTGKSFTKLTGRRVGRITGLDPAGPCFVEIHPELRLKSSDAEFVDVIHTNAGVFGIEEPLGHVDFYPNGGTEQPGCALSSCSHSRAWLLFAESTVNPHAFPAVKCEDWQAFQQKRCFQDNVSYMGLLSRPGTGGLYFLQTNDKPSFSLGTAGLKHRDVSLFSHLKKKLSIK